MSAMYLPEDAIRRDERLQELLSDRAIYGLEQAEREELARATQGRSEPDPSFEVAAAVVHVACLPASEIVALPEGLRDRLLRAGEQWCEERRGAIAQEPASLPFKVPVSSARDATSARAPSRGWTPWLVAAVATIAAVVGWMPRRATTQTSPGTRAAATNSPREARQAMLAAQPRDMLKASWGDWDKPEVAGVRGDVVWSDTAQAGYLSFENLPALDPSRERYQLWIIDSRGMEQRISGGIFDGSAGELVVPITPAIRVVGAAAFAITIERPEGTWVSDMKRRVVIAAKPS